MGDFVDVLFALLAPVLTIGRALLMATAGISVVDHGRTDLFEEVARVGISTGMFSSLLWLNRGWVAIIADVGALVVGVGALVIAIHSYKRTTYELLKAPDLFLVLSPVESPADRPGAFRMRTPVDSKRPNHYGEENVIFSFQNRGNKSAKNMHLQLVLFPSQVQLVQFFPPTYFQPMRVPSGSLSCNEYSAPWHFEISEHYAREVQRAQILLRRGEERVQIGAYVLKASDSPVRMESIWFDHATGKIDTEKIEEDSSGKTLLWAA